MKPVVDIQLLSGGGIGDWVPKHAVPPGLTYRLAVIQHTYAPELGDMYFDQDLWLALLDFVVGYDPWATFSIIENWRPDAGSSALSRAVESIFRPRAGNTRVNVKAGLSEFMEAWHAAPQDEREPPAVIQASQNDVIVLWMATEYWTAIGGPDAYHDSYTYSLFSRRDLTQDVRQFLESRPDASRWRIETTVAPTDQPVSPERCGSPPPPRRA